MKLYFESKRVCGGRFFFFGSVRFIVYCDRVFYFIFVRGKSRFRVCDINYFFGEIEFCMRLGVFGRAFVGVGYIVLFIGIEYDITVEGNRLVVTWVVFIVVS